MSLVIAKMCCWFPIIEVDDKKVKSIFKKNKTQEFILKE